GAVTLGDRQAQPGLASFSAQSRGNAGGCANDFDAAATRTGDDQRVFGADQSPADLFGKRPHLIGQISEARRLRIDRTSDCETEARELIGSVAPEARRDVIE